MKFDALGLIVPDEDGLDALYTRVQRFNKGQPVPTWLKRIEPPCPGVKAVFHRDCEVLRHNDRSSVWPVVSFTRMEPRLYFEALGLGNGHQLVGDCEFFAQQRS